MLDTLTTLANDDAIERVERIEQKFALSVDYIPIIRRKLENHAQRVRFSADDISRIVSAYFESSSSRDIGDLSVRVRSYVGEDWMVRDHVAVLDMKYERKSGSQTKFRAQFASWLDALGAIECVLRANLPSDIAEKACAQPFHPSLRVQYVREYFVADGMRFTLDDKICAGAAPNKMHVLPTSILEVKCLPSSSRPDSRILDILELHKLSISPSKRSLARKYVESDYQCSL